MAEIPFTKKSDAPVFVMDERAPDLVDFLRRENLVLVRRDRWGEALGKEQAAYRVRALHAPEDSPRPEKCAGCGWPIPCLTSQALDGDT